MTCRHRTGTVLFACASCVMVTAATLGVLMMSERSKDKSKAMRASNARSRKAIACVWSTSG